MHLALIMKDRHQELVVHLEESRVSRQSCQEFTKEVVASETR